MWGWWELIWRKYRLGSLDFVCNIRFIPIWVFFNIRGWFMWTGSDAAYLAQSWEGGVFWPVIDLKGPAIASVCFSLEKQLDFMRSLTDWVMMQVSWSQPHSGSSDAHCSSFFIHLDRANFYIFAEFWFVHHTSQYSVGNTVQPESIVLEDLGDDDFALGPHLEVKTSDRFRLKTIIRLKFGPCAMSWSPRSSSSSRYHEVNKKEVLRK